MEWARAEHLKGSPPSAPTPREPPQAVCDDAFAVVLESTISAAALDDVEVIYEWTKGYGRGDVQVQMRGKGQSQVRLHEHGKEPRTIDATIPRNRILRLLEVARDCGFACATTVHRATCFTDIGRTSITIRLRGSTREVYWDEEHGLVGTDRLEELRDAVLGLSDVLGVKYDWGPYGTTPYQCG
jgi:hypothetical protein